MSAPWMKFYPSDWRADPALRMCSVGARGLWMEMLCIMHEASPRGSLLVNGKAIGDRQIAALAGMAAKDAAPLLVELEEAGVFSREEDGTIYSRRMRRDDDKAERDRANGRKGGNPTVKRGVNPPDNHWPNGGVKAQKPEARSQRPEDKSSAQQMLPASQSCAAPSDFEMVLREAAGLVGSMAPALVNTGPIAALVEEGFGLDAVILPTLRAKAKAGKFGASWTYYVAAIREARPSRHVAVVPAVPVVWVKRDSPQGEAWTEHHRLHGKKLQFFENHQGEPARQMPSEWPPSSTHPATDRAA